MIIAIGWVVFAGYCAGRSLQVAILLKDPQHQPAVETLDKVIRNLDTLEDIALVNLPTREVMRRYRIFKDASADLSAHSASGSGSAATATATATEAGPGGKTAPQGSTPVKDEKGHLRREDSDLAFMQELKKNTNRAQEMDPRTSKEMRDLIAAEALKAAIPTKEMEIMEWEQALFRAAKRSLARAKIPTQRILKLVKTLQRSSRLQSGEQQCVG